MSAMLAQDFKVIQLSMMCWTTHSVESPTMSENSRPPRQRRFSGRPSTWTPWTTPSPPLLAAEQSIWQTLLTLKLGQKSRIQQGEHSRKTWPAMLKTCSCRAICWPWLQRRRWTWCGSQACSSSSPARSSSCSMHASTLSQPPPTSNAGNMELPTSANCVETKAQQITFWIVAQWCWRQTDTLGATTTW